MRKSTINLSSATTTTAKRKLDMTVEGRYYSKSEYNAMSATQKEQLWQMHKSNPKQHAPKKGKNNKDSVQVSKKQLANRTCRIAALESMAKNTYAIDSDSGNDTEPANN
eukprot:8150341-Ditylum_brightwellii.AAC.1